MTDTLDWHEWSNGSLPYGSRINAPDGRVKQAESSHLTDSTDTLGGTPLHESEPGLLDEEILPLEADWWKGPQSSRKAQEVRDFPVLLAGSVIPYSNAKQARNMC